MTPEMTFPQWRAAQLSRNVIIMMLLFAAGMLVCHLIHKKLERDRCRDAGQ